MVDTVDVFTWNGKKKNIENLLPAIAAISSFTMDHGRHQDSVQNDVVDLRE